MPASNFALLDGGALLVVLVGTLLATIARCGFRDIRAAGGALSHMVRAGFDEDANRASIARCAPEIRQRGHLSAEPKLPSDTSLARLINVYRDSGSIEAFHAAVREHRAEREMVRRQAVHVFDYAGEVAPIFGLVGTLFAITQLGPSDGSSAPEVIMSGVATAVLSSLYGVLTANLFCVPLAGAIERRGEDEEVARARLIEFFEAEVTGHRPVAQPRSANPMRDAA